MSLEELTRLVKPPERALDNDLSALPIAEKHLGLEFPTDYVEFCARYGTGCFGDHTFYFHIENILRADYPNSIERALAFHRELHRDGPDLYTLEIFPVQSGYLPCGAHVDGGDMGYVVCGDNPNEWAIATRSRDCVGFEMWDMSLTAFLFRALTHDIRPKMWRPDFPGVPEDVTFVPGPHYHQSVPFRPEPA